ncbi:unnamed protein product [marine sediment metagenome]|uniref:Glycosyl hydrolase family 13 catalytic domain-containing protein n=1 Tax=marine sediment metagenome TaxID=412755 RepID=X1B5Q7_9ZZZZ
MKPKKFRNLMRMYEKWFPYPYTPTWVFGNHDQMRRITKIGDNFNKAKINAILQLTGAFVWEIVKIVPCLQNLSIQKFFVFHKFYDMLDKSYLIF